jgi:hypothetical protein
MFASLNLAPSRFRYRVLVAFCSFYKYLDHLLIIFSFSLNHSHFSTHSSRSLRFSVRILTRFTRLSLSFYLFLLGFPSDFSLFSLSCSLFSSFLTFLSFSCFFLSRTCPSFYLLFASIFAQSIRVVN